MKRLLTLFTLSALILACSSENKNSTTVIPVFAEIDASTKAQVAGFLTDYFALNQMLIEDSLAGAKRAAEAFSITANNFSIEKLTPEQMDFYLVHSSSLKSSLESLAKSKDIEGARAELATVSESMYSMVKAFHPNEVPLYYQYCPMARDNKGANWLSTTKELVNPYMGQIMLACGRTQEIIE